MGVLERYPEIERFLDKSDDYILEAEETEDQGNRFLIVTQRGETDAGQLLFEITDMGLQLRDSDNTVQPGASADAIDAPAGTTCIISDPRDIQRVYAAAVAAVDTFSSANGPDRGNLACVWAVRKIAFGALNRWITRTDGTAVFDPELRRCFGGTSQDNEVPAGAIIISPTEGSNIGHVGLLGPHTGDERRLIYSNSSSAAMWKQNFTLGSWIARYRDRKGLRVRFYPIPNYVPVSS